MKLKQSPLPFLLLCLVGTAPITLPAAVEQVQPHSRGASFRLTEGRLQVEFVTDRIARVRATRNAGWSTTPSLMRVEVDEHPGRIRVKESRDAVELRSALLVIHTDTLHRPTALALGWAEEIAAPELRRLALLHVLREWTDRAPDAAFRYVEESPALNPAERAPLLTALTPFSPET